MKRRIVAAALRQSTLGGETTQTVCQTGRPKRRDAGGSTQAYVREEFDDPSRFYAPYAYLNFVAARKSRITLGTAITVMTFHHPVVLTKQAMTFDQPSGGRFRAGTRHRRLPRVSVAMEKYPLVAS